MIMTQCKYNFCSAYVALVKSPQGSLPSTPQLASVVDGLAELVPENELSKSNSGLTLLCCEMFVVSMVCCVVATGAATSAGGCRRGGGGSNPPTPPCVCFGLGFDCSDFVYNSRTAVEPT